MAAPDPELGKDDIEMRTYHFNVEEAQSKDGGRPLGRGNSRSGGWEARSPTVSRWLSSGDHLGLIPRISTVKTVPQKEAASHLGPPN